MNKLSLLIPVLFTVACSGDANFQSFWESLASNLLEIVVIIVTPILLLLARKLVQVIEDKTGLDLSERHEMLLQEYVLRGIAFAEEQAHKALKADKPPLSADEKKIMAVEFVAEQIDALGLPAVGRDALAKLIEAALNMKR